MFSPLPLTLGGTVPSGFVFLQYKLLSLDTQMRVRVKLCATLESDCLFLSPHISQRFPQVEGLEILPLMLSVYNLSAYKSSLCLLGLAVKRNV